MHCAYISEHEDENETADGQQVPRSRGAGQDGHQDLRHRRVRHDGRVGRSEGATAAARRDPAGPGHVRPDVVGMAWGSPRRFPRALAEGAREVLMTETM